MKSATRSTGTSRKTAARGAGMENCGLLKPALFGVWDETTARYVKCGLANPAVFPNAELAAIRLSWERVKFPKHTFSIVELRPQ